MEIAASRQGRSPRRDNLHVTVAFLGSVAAARVADVVACGAHAAAASDAFELTLDRVGGTARGIAWLAPSRVPPALDALHRALVDAVRDEGFVIERREFRPHVTLARNCTHPARRAASAPISWRVERLSLVHSTPGPGGSRYADVAVWPLAAAGSRSGRVGSP